MSEPPRSDPERPAEGGAEKWRLSPATDLHLPAGERLKSLSRERGLLDTVVGYFWWGAVRGYARVWHRLRVDGRAHLPTGAPFVLVANHASHLDAMILGAVLPRRMRHCTYPIAAGDTFFESRGTATFAAFVLNALPMWREKGGGRHAIGRLRERLIGEPCGYVLFPEGTRSRTGAIGAFKPGLGMLVAGTDVPVIPCHLRGAFAALPPDKHLPRPRKLHLRVGEPLRFADVANERAGWERIAGAAEAVVRRLGSP